MDTPFERIYSIILETDPQKKCTDVAALFKDLNQLSFEANDDRIVKKIISPGYPDNLELVPPRNLKRRGIQSIKGRNILMHSIAHIEYNAINLALDAAYRFKGQPSDFHIDWLKVANDEAKHFTMINNYLKENESYYGEYPAHDGLWSMTAKTAHDVVARMALVPRVLEARGLDVTPAIIKKLKTANDSHAIDILELIYIEEIEHVRIGSHWFKHNCERLKIDPHKTFRAMVKQYFIGEIKGPFNIQARLLAGFDEAELTQLANPD